MKKRYFTIGLLTVFCIGYITAEPDYKQKSYLAVVYADSGIILRKEPNKKVKRLQKYLRVLP